MNFLFWNGWCGRVCSMFSVSVNRLLFWCRMLLLVDSCIGIGGRGGSFWLDLVVSFLVFFFLFMLIGLICWVLRNCWMMGFLLFSSILRGLNIVRCWWYSRLMLLGIVCVVLMLWVMMRNVVLIWVFRLMISWLR